MFDVSHMICTQLHSVHLSIRVGDNSQRREEIVKKISNCAFECDNYYYIIISISDLPYLPECHIMSHCHR